MKSKRRGTNTSAPAIEVLNISPHGVWIWVRGREFLLTFHDYPCFRAATVQQIQNVALLHEKHLRWPDLDVDVELECLRQPEKFPLVYHP